MAIIIIVLALFALLLAAAGAFPGTNFPYGLPFAVALLAICILLLVFPTLHSTGATMLLFAS